jgi:hypothetical protein
MVPLFTSSAHLPPENDPSALRGRSWAQRHLRVPAAEWRQRGRSRQHGADGFDVRSRVRVQGTALYGFTRIRLLALLTSPLPLHPCPLPL